MYTFYSKWRANSQRAEDKLKELLKLFKEILLRTAGDVDAALEFLESLDGEYDVLGTIAMQELIDELKRQGIIEVSDEANHLLTSRGAREMRRDAFAELFSSLKRSPVGSHESPHSGEGIDRLSETKSFHFGDQPANIDLTQTLTNSLKRSQSASDTLDTFDLREEDLEMYETEHEAACATVLMIDISHSMILYGEDRITPAKRVAMALAEMILTRYAHDTLDVVAFGDVATTISVDELPRLSVGPFHTNTKAGLQLARSILRRRGNMNKQIVMITDGKPSAIIDENGMLYKNSFGLDPRIVNKTLDEAIACRRERIPITTFMIAQDPLLVNFVDELTRANRGRAYFSSPDDLGKFLLVDYVRNRKKRT